MRRFALLLLLALLRGAAHAAMPPASQFAPAFPLLAESSHRVATDDGALVAMRDVHHARRTAFLISPDGKIARVYLDVDPQQNSARVRSDLAVIKASS